MLSFRKKSKPEIKENDVENLKLENTKLKLLTNQKKLKDINDINTQSMIDLITKGSSSTPAFLHQEELVADYHFFITLIGIIEARVDEVNKDIEFNKNFDNEDEILKLEKDKLYYLEQRDLIVKEFLSYSNSKIDSINDALKEYPTYSKFNKIAEDASENQTQLSLHYELMMAYNEGYIASMYILPEDILKEYRKLYVDLDNYKKQNGQRIALYKSSEV